VEIFKEFLSTQRCKNQLAVYEQQEASQKTQLNKAQGTQAQSKLGTGWISEVDQGHGSDRFREGV
jgi:hypothetical protein